MCRVGILKWRNVYREVSIDMTGAPDLPQLDVIELRVGMDVGVGHADELAAGISTALLQGRVQGLQHSDQRHIVLLIYTWREESPWNLISIRPEHPICALSVRGTCGHIYQKGWSVAFEVKVLIKRFCDVITLRRRFSATFFKSSPRESARDSAALLNST